MSEAARISNAPVSLIDALAAIEEDLDAELALRQEMVELVDLGEDCIFPDLRMMLHAECAARGIDWHDLLACAVRRHTRVGLPS